MSLASSNSDGFLTLNIISINVSDEGTYTCVATLDIARLEVPRNTTANTTYEFLTLGKVHESYVLINDNDSDDNVIEFLFPSDDPVIDITVSGSNVAGSTYTV